MLEISSIFIAAQLSFFIGYYIFSIITSHNLIINKKVILFAFLFGIMCIFSNLYLDVKLKFLVNNLSANIVYMSMFKEKINRTILAALFNYILMMISETIFTLIFIYGIGKVFTIEFVTKNTLGILFSNVTIILMTVILIKIKFIQSLFKEIIKWYEDSRLIKFIIIILIAFVLVAFFTYQNFIGIHSIVYLIEVNIALILIFIFVIGYFNQRAQNKLILTDCDQLLEYVKTYEKIADEKSKNQHEYKNQLILLKSMIKENDKKCIAYINKLLKVEDEQENNQYLDRLKNLPSGLKGFILYKIDIMLQKGIIPFVDISDTLNLVEVKKMCDNNLRDISRAIGVYLDNAIEAACESKNKYLLIDAQYMDGELTFSFSNTYSGNIDFSKIDKAGYTTKGKNHGHGLALIKEIIDKNPKLEQHREIIGIYFNQKLIIKK